MSNLIHQIQIAQRNAGEQACIDHLIAQGLHAAAPVEPTFTLRAQDETASEVLKLWIELNVERLGNTHPKIQSARSTLLQMLAWPIKKKVD